VNSSMIQVDGSAPLNKPMAALPAPSPNGNGNGKPSANGKPKPKPSPAEVAAAYDRVRRRATSI